MAVDCFMVFQNYANRGGGGYLASESLTDWSKTSEALGKPFKTAGQGKVFEVSDYSFDVEQTLNIGSQSSGAGAGKIAFNPFSITRSIDISSTQMFLNACAGTPFQRVFLGLRKSTGGDVGGSLNVSGQFFLLFTFALVAVKTLSWAHDEEAPKETITFDYGGLQIQYSKQMPNGSLDAAVIAGWDRTRNVAGLPDAAA